MKAKTCSSEWVLARLNELSENKHREFNLRIMPKESVIIGVRTPLVKKLATEISRFDKDTVDYYFESVTFSSYEEVLLCGFVIAFLKLDEVKRREKIAWFLPHIESWASCDLFVCALKNGVKKDRQGYFLFVKSLLSSKEEHVLRFGLVMLFWYWLEDEHIDFILDTLSSVKDDRRAVLMAVAWGLSFCAVDYPKRVILILKQGLLDDFTHRMTIQKSVDSRRVLAEVKASMKLLRR